MSIGSIQGDGDLGEVRAAVVAGVRVGPMLHGKPYFTGWRQRATRNPEIFDRQCRKLPDALWAAPLGRQVVAIRVRGDGGANNLKALEAELGSLPATISIASPDGSFSSLYSVSQPTATVDLAPGVHSRGLGRSVALPPTLHRPTGRPYTWRVAPSQVEALGALGALGELPEAWAERIASLDAAAAPPVPNARLFSRPAAPRRIGVGADAATG